MSLDEDMSGNSKSLDECRGCGSDGAYIELSSECEYYIKCKCGEESRRFLAAGICATNDWNEMNKGDEL